MQFTFFPMRGQAPVTLWGQTFFNPKESNMLRILVLITALFGTMASAELTPRDMRQIAYDGDIELMEATFARLHQESIDGDLPYDTFRWLVSGLIVSHPDVLAFSERWINAYPFQY
jgi:hypothetical protein